MLLCSFPAFIVGLLEDVTKSTGVIIRLIGIILSSIAVYFIIPAKVSSLGLPFLDLYTNLPMVGFILTVFAITGLTNAYNIIDGLNGLSSMIALLTLFCILYVCIINEDLILIKTSVILIGSIFGFFICNYPKGYIFLGDNGAYLIGYFISLLSILVVQRNSNVSPFFALIVNAYPIFETLFTIWRRKFHYGREAMSPDRLHFHSLVYRRMIKMSIIKNNSNNVTNSKTSPLLWALSLISIVPASLWWNDTKLLIISGTIFCFIYLISYSILVHYSKKNILII